MYELANMEKVDRKIFDLIASEIKRQRDTIELIASENYASNAVIEAMGTPLTNKYADGYPDERIYVGCEFVDEIENIAIERAKKLFKAKYANVQPYSGSQANMAVIFATISSKDTILSMNVLQGGHDTHGTNTNYTGKFYNTVRYCVNKEGLIDYEEIYKLAKKHKPKIIFAGASAYPREIDFKKIGEISKEVSAIFVADIAHIAGLVVSDLHNNPFPHADIVTSTTHKTLRGSRGGIILTNDKDLAEKIDKAVFPGSQGSPLMHVIAAKAIAFEEALSEEFKMYSVQIIKNAKALSKKLIDNGFSVVTNGTDNHLFILDVCEVGLVGKQAEKILYELNISAGANPVSTKDTLENKLVSGIRIGTAAITTRGFTEKDMIELADIITLGLKDFEKNKTNLKQRVSNLLREHPLNY